MPVAVAAAMIGISALVAFNPIVLPKSGDIRETIFGPELSYLRFAAFAALIVAVVRLIDAVVFDFLFASKKNITAPMLLRDITAITLYIVLFALAIYYIFDYPVRTLLTSATVIAAVLGLALQDTLGNLFAGIAIHTENAFEVGDVVRSGDHIGVVESVNWRSTTFRTFNNNIVVMPNSLIARERIEIFERGELNARSVHVGLPYDEPPSRIIEVLQRAASNVEHVAPEPACLVRISGFDQSAVTYEVKYWTREYQFRDIIDAEIRRVMMYSLRRNNISIPFPIRSLQMLPPKPPEAATSEEMVLERLRGVDVLEPLSEDERSAIGAATHLHEFSRGETVLRHGTPGDSMFVVDQGTVSVRVPSEGGATEVAQLGTGSVFGEMALLTGEARSADVVAITDVTVFEIGKDAFKPVLLENPQLAASISARMVERRDHAAAAAGAVSGSHGSMLNRIRSYFGLR